jgi:hypothetical protein
LTQRKENGGLGIPDLRDLNMCLLASWVQRYYDSGSKLWREIVDCKYNTNSPNLFYCNGREAYPFWKGVLWASQAALMGYRWQVGKGDRTRFWKDHWFGTCSLAIQCWEIFVIVNDHHASIKEVWDGENLKFTFRRTVDNRLMNQWHELVQIASNVQFNDEDDSIIWKFNSSGKYSVQSLYAIINDRGVRQVYTQVMWKIHVPSRFHIFLWLLANNKILTRENLAKEGHWKICHVYSVMSRNQQVIYFFGVVWLRCFRNTFLICVVEPWALILNQWLSCGCMKKMLVMLMSVPRPLCGHYGN